MQGQPVVAIADNASTGAEAWVNICANWQQDRQLAAKPSNSNRVHST
jgi:hypothetical protein